MSSETMEPLIIKLDFKKIRGLNDLQSETITGVTNEQMRFISHNLGVSWEAEGTEPCDEWEDDEDEICGYETRNFTVVGGAPGLIYAETDYTDSLEFHQFNTQYAINPHPETPPNFEELTFELLPFRVRQTQGIFYGLEKQKELYVSSDGINFDHVEFPSSPPCENSTFTSVYCGTDFTYQIDHGHFDVSSPNPGSDSKLQGSLFVSRHYPPSRTELTSPNSILKPLVLSRPWTTLFRYDIQKNEMKFILDYCYDLTVVSAEEGILIASYVTNPLEHLDTLEELRIRSVITFNDGADWESMRGPSGADFGVVNNAWRNDRASNAPGHLMVYGREGPIEDYKSFINAKGSEFASSLSTYLTRDYGRSWCKVADGIMRWAVGGSGEIVLMFPKTSGDHILYSIDGGMAWNKLYMDIPTRIRTPPECTSRRFLLEYVSGGVSRAPQYRYYVLSFDHADQKISSETKKISDESLSKL